MRITPAEPVPADIYTYVGVKPGDVLELGKVDAEGTPAAINVVVPETAVGTVTVRTSCGSGSGTAPNIAISVMGCPSMMDFYVTDSDNGAFVKRAAYGPSVDLSLEGFSGSLAATLSSTNVALNTALSAEIQIVSGTYPLYSTGARRIETNTETVNMPNVSNIEQLLITNVAGPDGYQQMNATRSMYSGSPQVIDYAAMPMLPRVAGIDFSPTGLSWTESGPGTAEFVVSRLDVTRGELNNPLLDREYRRILIAPHAGMTLKLPTLQGADAIYNPINGDSVGTALGIGSFPGGYDAIRELAFTVNNLIRLTPMDGTARVSYAGGAPVLGD